jgi:DNA-binding beta-propeller fold protein YncE
MLRSLRLVRFLPRPRHRVRAAIRAVILATLASPLIALAACDSESSGDPGDPVDAGAPDAIWDPPCFLRSPGTQASCPPIGDPVWYTRFSLKPAYQTTPEATLDQFQIHGRALAAGDFQTAAVETSVEEKLDQVALQLAEEYGVALADVDILPDGPGAEQRTRAAGIPFRGNPTDVALLTVDGKRRAYVPLGGDPMTPGNEVAIVSLDTGEVTRVQVGVHPQQVFAHQPSGLVFVCNEYSNYISIIDSRIDDLLRNGSEPVEIPTPGFCTDLVLVQRAPASGDPDELSLYIASELRSSVYQYDLNVIRDALGAIDTVEILAADPESFVPLFEYTGLGASPSRLQVDDSQTRLFVTSHRGGELAMVDLVADRVVERVSLGAPAVDVLPMEGRLFVPTTTPHRGLLQEGAPTATELQAGPIEVRDTSGDAYEIHPGAQFDGTASYDVEDLRSGIFELSIDAGGGAGGIGDQILYVTDDNDADVAFSAEQKQLAGALPWSIARNAAGSRVYVPLFGADLVQELDVTAEAPALRASGRTFVTRELPSAVAVDDDANQLVVVSFGGDVLELFDLASGDIVSEIDLGYASPRYPATVVEAGEYLFATAKWSNDGRKSCAGCHSQRLSSDGLGFAIGTAAPTTLRQVKPMHDLFATGSYLWSGGAPGGNLGAMAFAAQVRTNCEITLYGMVEGPHTDPAQRDGDPANVTAGPSDALCRPDTSSIDPSTGLPGNLAGGTFSDIQAEIQAQEQLADQAMTDAVRVQLTTAGVVQDGAPLLREDLERALGFYLVSELRLPANPLAQELEHELLSSVDVDKLLKGEELFRNQAGCASCHDPAAQGHPFTDNRNAGSGSAWASEFVAEYALDATFLDILPGGIPAPLAIAAEVPFQPSDPTVFQPVLDGLVPACFSPALCLRLDDPLAVRDSDPAEEARRLRRLATFYLSGPGFLPGAVVGQPVVNTPSLRGLWLQRSFLHHGLARSILEVILAPGHSGLRSGERGYAVSADGTFDVHGSTSDLSSDELDALWFYLLTIE